MSRRMRLRILDSTFELSLAEDPSGGRTSSAAAELQRLLAGFAAPQEPSGADGTAVVHRLEIEAGPGRPDPVPDALARINAIALEEYAGFAVHAGVLSRDGVTVAVPGPSGRGKSTLVAACVRAGFDYVSDEALCLPWPDDGAGAGGVDTADSADQPLRITAYPRPLGLSPWSVDRLGLPGGASGATETHRTAADLGGRTCRRPPALRHVILLDSPGPETQLVPARRSEVASALLRLSFNAWRRPEAAFALAHRIAADTDAWRLRSGAPSDAADRLVRLSDETGR